ncbi:hypothetical protein EV182_001628 [Spiromyces aspiralis]|uniref:Uncharacterized protein n=1 Tax=Spiromyces aspiralis TaxID=68401 RepID=A0ACC1I0H8_9FUNG|nr:hypothetical protein EV182_001628 [Spiromyces aspiralis]
MAEVEVQDIAPVSTSARLAKLRELMRTHGINAYIVPSEDAHQSEYVAACDERRAYISGFNGSAGTAVVTEDSANMFTDGRYFLQASQQMDANWTLMKVGMPNVPNWNTFLTKHYRGGGARVGIDPTLIPASKATELKANLTKTGGDLVPIETNLIDAIWPDRPERSKKAAFVHKLEYAGEEFKSKLQRVRASLKSNSVEGIVVAKLDEIAWLFNLRGDDILYNPVFFAYAIVTLDRATLYVDSEKLTDKVRAHLEDVEIKPYDAIFDELKVTASACAEAKLKFLTDTSASWALVEALGHDNIVIGTSPVTMFKAIKNDVEIEGMRRCHIRDGVAVVKYLSWLEDQLLNRGGNLKLTECDVADRLEEFRREQDKFFGLSFDTISSVGSNGAIIHYKPTRPTDAKLDISKLYLVDSGGQYLDGTTDVTRTCHFSEPTDWEKECFTRVLKAHIALDRAIFPTNTTGYALDCIARLPLWEKGLDFRHGTGHGVGAFLNVHEGPQGIAMRPGYASVGLKANMTVTNEPGFYEDGKFGIRIENTCIIVKTDTEFNIDDKEFLTFESATLVPIQKKMIDRRIFTDHEVEWLNAYHKRVWDTLSPLVKDDELTYEWLKRETSPL